MMRSFLCLLLAVTIAGCGYTTGSLLPPKYRKIAVQPFVNKVNNIDMNGNGNSNVIYVPLLESNVRTAIIDRFLFDGSLHIADPDKADLVLNGALIGVAQDQLRQDVNQNVQEYQIRIIVSLTLTDRDTGKVLWTEPSFTGETTYFLTGSGATSQSAAIDNALTDLATRVVERTIENW
jgi:flavin-binding protein dodecin